MKSIAALITSLSLSLGLPFAAPTLPDIPAQIQRTIDDTVGAAQSLSSNFFLGAAPVQMSPEQRELIDATNRFRVQHGRAPLRPSASLNRLAQNWSATLARTGSFHHNPILKTPRYMGIGENIYMAPYAFNADDAIKAWANSPGHRRNMLNASYAEIGVGITTTPNGTTYVVQNFRLR